MKNWIVLGVALLGGVIGGGAVSVLLRERADDTRLQVVEQLASSNHHAMQLSIAREVDDAKAAQSWFCVQLGDKLTSCDKDIEMCRRQMPKTDLPCVMLPLAWCGTYHCTATRDYCETVSPDNGRCELRRP